MPAAVRRIYEDALPGLAAEEQLLRIEAATFPHMNDKDRKRIQRGYADELPKPDAPPDPPREDVLHKFGIAFVDEREVSDA